MISTRLSLLAILALFVTAAQSASVSFTNGLPANSIMDEGTTFEVKWSWDGGKQATGQLVLTTFTQNNMNSAVNTTLEDKLNLAQESYSWVVMTSKGHKSLDWYYRFSIIYNGDASQASGRAFRINTASSTSSTAGTGTATNSPGTSKDPSGESSSLSGGVIAGIVVGSVAGVGILAALVGLVLYYRRKSRRGETKGTDLPAPKLGADTAISSTPETRDGASLGIAAATAMPQYQKAELDAAERQSISYELEARPISSSGMTRP
ncbi:hypothetical protein F5B22DRAFT_366066 [Xylaria bambusicola]|uniref:uncharacterized protein n=1 Tax=Xylaria bambusicola TaxID=326684 RepID=UPI0020088A35|nr:uncharacterized protein F5B22DRAFT_366066 [Xylaria bambusicola]KAI0509208.1 hypothetical protein F5B22DRAFT_366066 [Xylaria bambusicola]